MYIIIYLPNLTLNLKIYFVLQYFVLKKPTPEQTLCKYYYGYRNSTKQTKNYDFSLSASVCLVFDTHVNKEKNRILFILVSK